MSEPSNNDFLLGRIDGKVDTILAMQAAHGGRLDNLEKRMGATEISQAASDARGTTSKDGRSLVIAVIAIALSALGVLKSYLIGTP